MIDFPHVTLLPAKERSVRLYHPWIFSGAVKSVDENVSEGDVVEVYTHDGKYLATGHFHAGSIKVRIFSFEKTNFQSEFWDAKLDHAINLRRQLGLLNNRNTNVFRLIHAEGDGLPGLIIDIYGSTAVIQAHTIGMHKAIPEIVKSLLAINELQLESIFDKSEDTLQKQASVIESNRFVFGKSSDAVVYENGIQFYVNWEEGQKTGFFIDQRDNRKLLQNYVHGKKVLNTFSYSGGFSMYALKAGAELVHSIDSSKKAKEWAEKNATLNGVSEKHLFHQEDAFDHLRASSNYYDVIILDPPAFAKHLSSANKAIGGYRNLNTEGFNRIAPGGILFTFSCSQVIDKTMFRKVVFQAAAQSGRNVKVLHQLSQGPDHPISIYHPEGEYLKGLVLYVE